MQYPESLLAQTLKAKYFYRTDFRTAKQSAHDSFTWRSILEGRKVLELGLVWVVGNGSSIDVWREPWLFLGEEHKVTSPNEQQPENCKVRDLILNDYSDWNIPLVQWVFSQDEARRILATPFSGNRPDVLA